jgi:hypothetical protein
VRDVEGESTVADEDARWQEKESSGRIGVFMASMVALVWQEITNLF